jgi:hypothetical protein
MATWQYWNTNVTTLSEITSGVGLGTLTAGFLLTASGVIATSTALVVLPYLIPAVCIGLGLLQITHGFLLSKALDDPNKNNLASNEYLSGGIWLLIALSDCSAPSLCLLLSLNALAQAVTGYFILKEIKKAPTNYSTHFISAIKEYTGLAALKAISWAIVAAGIALFSPVAIGGGLTILTGTYVYSNRVSLFGCKSQVAAAQNSGSSPSENRMEVYSGLPM